ncbi:hypothetical protein BVY03_03145 [bacterium K02(2017)]|nr:hypothetical protein BVY03_03145 [bacterium K02(2017)]
MTILVKYLTQKEYQNYGDVLSIREDIAPVLANNGTAQRYNKLSNLKNKRPDSALPNLCFYHVKPQINANDKVFNIKMLEKHHFSTQIFSPMHNVDKYLVIVALGEDEPDLSTLKAFYASGEQGITYHPGVWHHPLIAMFQPSSFTCVVYEDGSQNDCQTFAINPNRQIKLC